MRPTKTTHIFQINQTSVKFSSNFDSGNLRCVTQTAQNQFLIQSSLDSYEIPVSNKSFFHFSVENFPIKQTIILKITNANLLSCLGKEQIKKYRPFYSTNGQTYHKLDPNCVSIDSNCTPPILKLQYLVTTPIIYFSFALPYSYIRYLNMIRDLPDSTDQIYIHKEVLCYSTNLNLVHMISLTSFDKITQQDEKIGELSNGIILPQKGLHPSKKYFDKPVILISGRVHPGQSQSSWAIQGIIKYLLSNSEQAKLLLKYFQVVIVPMLNPDGVEEGLYRLDTKGHNLNRYYLISDNRQPSIYSMKHLIRHYNQTKRLLYYFDFHGHPSWKGSFLYGNAIDQIAYQAQTELFAKILGMKCKTFQEKFCIFDRQQMTSKDKYDMYTKEGCARVYAFKTSNILHSYTVQMGFHSCTEFSYPTDSSIDDFYYDQASYYQEGVAIIQCVLESSGLKCSQNIKKSELRKIVANDINHRQDRFRKEEKQVMLKKNNVNQIIQNQYWKPIYEKFFKEQLIKSKKGSIKIKNKSNFKMMKRDSFTEGLSNFMSENLPTNETNPEQNGKQKQPFVFKEESKSFLIGVLENRKKLQTTSITFSIQNVQKNKKSLNQSCKNQLRGYSKPLSFIKELQDRDDIQILNSKNRIRILKKQCRNKFDTTLDRSLKEQEHMFSDNNLRSQQKITAMPQRFLISQNQIQTRINEFNSMFHLQKKRDVRMLMSSNKYRKNQIHTLFISDKK